MAGVQDQLMILQRDVDAARQSYDTLRQRLNEAALRSQISQSSATIVKRASLPLWPSWPNVPLWLFAGFLVACVAGVGAAAGLELLRPRVRSAGGLSKATEVEVLGDLTGTPIHAPSQKAAA